MWWTSLSFVEKRALDNKEQLVKLTERAHLSAASALAQSIRRLRKQDNNGEKGGKRMPQSGRHCVPKTCACECSIDVDVPLYCSLGGGSPGRRGHHQGEQEGGLRLRGREEPTSESLWLVRRSSPQRQHHPLRPGIIDPALE